MAEGQKAVDGAKKRGTKSETPRTKSGGPGAVAGGTRPKYHKVVCTERHKDTDTEAVRDGGCRKVCQERHKIVSRETQ